MSELTYGIVTGIVSLQVIFADVTVTPVTI